MKKALVILMGAMLLITLTGSQGKDINREHVLHEHVITENYIVGAKQHIAENSNNKKIRSFN